MLNLMAEKIKDFIFFYHLRIIILYITNLVVRMNLSDIKKLDGLSRIIIVMYIDNKVIKQF